MSKIVRRTREEVLRLWVDALRSGKYRQTEGGLRDAQGYCCLGVLCDLARKDGGPSWRVNIFGLREYMGSDALLPSPVAEFVGLTESQQVQISKRNDSGETFRQIADYIEATYLRA